MAFRVNQIVRSKRKTLALIVKADGSVIVRAPLRASQRLIREFVEKHRQWIETKQAEALATLPLAPRQYAPGETCLYLGIAYPLEIVEGQKEGVTLDETFKLSASRQGEAAAAFERWYRARARQVISERVEFFARQQDFQYKGIKITSARTRWGSCSVTGSLSFSWRLILAPLPVVDYVVVHELVHTVFHNHSKQFWNKVGVIMPDYAVHRTWLREHGQELLT